MNQLEKSTSSLATSNHKKWTKADDQILRQMVKEKATTAQVAIVLGRTKSSVWSRKSFLGIDGRLSSSKGKQLSAPTTLTKYKSRKNGGEKTGVILNSVKNTKNPRVIQNMDLASISALAKASGAKIVITFE